MVQLLKTQDQSSCPSQSPWKDRDVTGRETRPHDGGRTAGVAVPGMDVLHLVSRHHQYQPWSTGGGMTTDPMFSHEEPPGVQVEELDVIPLRP